MAGGGASEEVVAGAVVIGFKSVEAVWRMAVEGGTSGLVEGGALRMGMLWGMVVRGSRAEVGMTLLGAEVGMAMGTEVGATVGTEVGVAIDTEVGVTAGTEIVTATETEVVVGVAVTEVGMVTGTEVEVGTGAEVGMVMGAEVDVATGTEVGMAGGADTAAVLEAIAEGRPELVATEDVAGTAGLVAREAGVTLEV